MTNLLIETIDGVRWIFLNRPDKLNALDAELKLALEEALGNAAADPEVRCLVLTGSGRGFCAGGDRPPAQDGAHAVAEIPIDKIDRRTAELSQAGETAALLHRMGKPTIAMINGPCAGAGLSLAAACDLRVGGASAMMTSAFIRLGLAGDYGGAWYWTRIIGASRTRRLYMLSERFSGSDALDFGLLDFLAPDDELRGRTAEIAGQIAAGSPRGHRLMKASLNAAHLPALGDYLGQEALNMALSDV
jgi:2-(1,2-epoxy-1,2-dihydrophenyl)acetyl-CoA isomerase